MDEEQEHQQQQQQQRHSPVSQPPSNGSGLIILVVVMAEPLPPPTCELGLVSRGLGGLPPARHHLGLQAADAAQQQLLHRLLQSRPHPRLLRVGGC